MAARLGVQECRYLCWERGDKAPNPRALPALLAALGEAPPAPPEGDLGVRLNAWRIAAGRSQIEAATLAKVDGRTLRTLEQGRRVSLRTAQAVEALLKT